MSPAFNTRPSWKVIKPDIATRAARTRKGPRARSWTHQEVSRLHSINHVVRTYTKQEQYLVESRDRRVPYRRIASCLKKTELACRLHYHQLTVVKARQLTDTTPPIESPPATPPSTCGELSLRSVYSGASVSPPVIEHRTLPSLRIWFDDKSRHQQRSCSLPTPRPSRPSTPEATLCRSRSLISSPLPPVVVRHSGPQSLFDVGLGFLAASRHHRVTSFPPLANTGQGKTTLHSLVGTLGVRQDHWQPRYYAQQSDSWTNNHSRKTELVGRVQTASKTDRCSVQSLLNHYDIETARA
jgi:hypothetical protein